MKEMENETDRAIEKYAYEDSDVQDYPKSHGRPILSRLLACLALGFITAFFLIKLVVELKRYLWP